MTNDSAAAIRQARDDWMARHRQAYLQSGGAEGHIMDLRNVGGRAFTTHCLIRTKGRKSGRMFITPLIYGDIGGEVVIVASKGGADQHPTGTSIFEKVHTSIFRLLHKPSGPHGVNPKILSDTQSGIS